MNKTIVLLYAFVFSILFSLLLKWIQTGNPFKEETIVVGIVIFLNIVILGSIACKIFQNYSNKSPSEIKRRILPSLVFFVFVAMFISLSLVSLGVYSFYLIKGLDPTGFMKQLFQVELPAALKQFSIWILIGSAVFFYIIWRKAIDREQKLREENLKYRYQNLKSQLNPHFLFNCLNMLSEIVYEDAKKADKYIQKLSGIYRYLLENEDIDVVPVAREIEFVKQYFDLQKVREGNKIQLDLNFQEEEEDVRVLPVSLQMLVENALKHNARSEKKPLKIRIFRSNDQIVVSNAIQRKNIPETTSKKGLLNLKERMKLILHKNLIIEESAQEFTVKLPMLKNQK